MICPLHKIEHKADKGNKMEKKPIIHCNNCGLHLNRESIRIGRNLCSYCR